MSAATATFTNVNNDPSTYFGVMQGRAVAVSGLNESGVVVVQVLHSMEPSSLPAPSDIDWANPFQELMKGGKISVSWDGNIAWLTIYRSALAESNRFEELLGGFIEGLESAGILGETHTCHSCLANPVEQITYCDGRVECKCESCLSEEQAKDAAILRNETAGIVDLFAICLFGFSGAIVGSIGWGLVQIGIYKAYGLLENWMPGREGGVHVPVALLLAVAGACGFLAGAPSGWLIARVKRRRRAGVEVITTACALFAVLLGECILTAWIVYNTTGEWSAPVVIRVLPKLWWSSGFGGLGIRVAGGFIAIAIALGLATPKKLPVRQRTLAQRND